MLLGVSSQWAVSSMAQASLHWELAHGEIGPSEESLSQDLEGEQSLYNGRLVTFENILSFNTAECQEQRSSGQTQLCKTNPVTKANTVLL